jgi:hypothetical protein
MGCWNKTCGISGLFVKAHEKVYVITLLKNIFEERSLATSFWYPIPFLFISTYDEYGSGENSHKNIKYVLQAIKDNLVEMPLEENKYHDIAINKDIFNEKLFFDAVLEGRLKVHNKGYDKTKYPEIPVDFTMLRKDVVDYICENHKKDMYTGSGHVCYKYKDIISLIPEYIERLEKYLLNKDEDCLWLFKLSNIYNHEERNFLSIYLRSIDIEYQFQQVFDYKKIIIDLMLENKKEEVKEILENILLFSYINSFMYSVRKQWMPGCYEGCQHEDHEPYKILNGSIDMVIKKIEEDHEEFNF